MGLEYKALPVTGFKVLDESEGIVEAIVSVTGLVDRVKDNIVPGAYTKSLTAKTPKGVWGHDWNTPVSKTLEAKELMPGDAGLPKTTADGKPWPKTAGAVKVKTQFNLETQAGRDAYSNVTFFGTDQEWSIGYQVPKGMGVTNPKTGIRDIKQLDWYEYSPVLFGAMPFARSLDEKSDNLAEEFRKPQLQFKSLVDAFGIDKAERMLFIKAEIGSLEVDKAPNKPGEGDTVEDALFDNDENEGDDIEDIDPEDLLSEDKDDSEDIEEKMYPNMTGSLEELQDKVRAAVNEKYKRPANMPYSDDYGYTSCEATFDDHVIVTRRSGGASESYSIPYTVNDDGDVELGEPSEVVVTVTAKAEAKDMKAGQSGPSMRALEAASRALKQADLAVAAAITSQTAEPHAADAEIKELEFKIETLSEAVEERLGDLDVEDETYDDLMVKADAFDSAEDAESKADAANSILDVIENGLDDADQATEAAFKELAEDVGTLLKSEGADPDAGDEEDESKDDSDDDKEEKEDAGEVETKTIDTSRFEKFKALV